MAKHLAEGRALPLYFYGQAYMLGVQAWLAAPLFLIAGASVALLKLPLVLINGAAAGLLVWSLIRYAQLPPLGAFAASVFFILAPPVTGSLLVAAMGGSVEPFLYVLLVWLLRDRPVLCGLIAGVGFLHREFSVYGLSALVVTITLYNAHRWRELLPRWAITGTIVLIVLEMGRLILPYGDPFGPEMPKFAMLARLSNVDAVAARVQCTNGPEILANVPWLLSHNLPALAGTLPKGADEYFLGAAIPGSPIVWLLLCAGVLAALVRVASVAWLRRLAPPAFLAFLFLVGVQAAAVYVASCGVRDPMLVRYTFLVLLVPIAIAAAYLRVESVALLRRGALLLLFGWLGWSAYRYAGVIADYIAHPPAAMRTMVARELERRGIKYGYAPYWDAYHITFVSNERVILAAGPPSRIYSYDNVVARAPQRVYVQPNPCPGELIGALWVCGERRGEPAAAGPAPGARVGMQLPPPGELVELWDRLEVTYRDVLKRTPSPTAIDREGIIAWTHAYLQHRVGGCDHASAVLRVFAQIDGKGSAVACVPIATVAWPPPGELAEFGRQLEAKYATDLRRAAFPRGLDRDDAMTWIAQYIQYRASGCASARAVTRVMRQVEGLPVLPAC